MQAEANVRVGVRVRPLSANEIAADSRVVISNPTQDCIRVGDGTGDKTFTFDNVFPSHLSQADLFNNTAAPMIQSFLDGYNVTVLAYGQTGSGKTFTMGSEIGSDNTGLIPRFLDEIFTRIGRTSPIVSRATDESTAVVCNPLMALAEEQAGGIRPTTTLSFLEIYGEDIYDLLQEPEGDGKSKSLALREDGGYVSVVGLNEIEISGSMEAMEQLRIGTQHRTTASTLMNTVSSRSHAVFTITLHQTLFGEGHSEEGQEVVSKLSFVDLAGSERLKRTGAEGQRMKEGIQINKGLLALGNVINALADEERKEKVHVGYRESKLTRLLQDALGGNSQTLFLACISPAEVNLSETLSTLRYANRARNIQNKPVKNTDPVQEEMRKLHAANTMLRLELVKEKFGNESLPEVGMEELLAREDVKKFVDDLNKRLGSSSEMELSVPPHSDGHAEAPLLITSGKSTMAAMTPHLTTSTVAGAQRRVTLLQLKRQSHVMAQPAQGAAEDAPMLGRGDDNIAEAAPTFCEEDILDPENDMRMINKLLEMLKKDEEFDKIEKERVVDMGAVDEEIEQKEEILEQLKHNIKQYQVLLEENDLLVRELQSLEGEKQTLLDQLTHETKNKEAPSTNSVAFVSKLKERLKAVETRLKTQTSEQKKRENAMSLIRRDSARCKELESNILNLKKAKVDMVKKQKDAQAQFKGYMDVKNKELAEARKSRQKQRLESSKLESENRKLITMMSRKVKAHQKTEEALQKNKAHLVKVLAMRKRERQRQSVAGNFSSKARRTTMANQHRAEATSDLKDSTEFAPEDETVQSIKFCLVQMMSNRVDKQQRLEQEQKLEGEYDALQRQVFQEVAALNKLKEPPPPSLDTENEAAVEAHSVALEEQEQRLEELVVKLDLVGQALSDLPAGCSDEGRSRGPDGAAEDDALELSMISKLEAPALRTVLWSFLDGFSDAELSKRTLEDACKRKDAEAKAAEAKQEKLERQVQELRKGFHERVSILQSERIEMAQAVCSPTQSHKKQGQLGALRAMNANLEEKLDDEMRERESLESEVRRLRDLEARMEVVNTSQGEKAGDDATLLALMEEIQKVWSDLGTEEEKRASKLDELKSATGQCAKGILAEEKGRQVEMRELISTKQAEVQTLCTVLGLEMSDLFALTPIPDDRGSSERLVTLEATLRSTDPQVGALLERSASLKNKATSFAKKLKAFEDTHPSPSLLQLLQLDVDSLFAPGGDGVLRCTEKGVPFAAILDAWETEVRVLTIRFAEVSSSHATLLERAREQAVELGIFDFDDLAALLEPFKEATSLRGGDSGEALETKVFKHILVVLEEGGSSHNRAEYLDREFVLCLTRTCKEIATAHADRDAAAEAATNFIEAFFVAVSVRLRETAGSETQPRLSRDRVATLVSEVSNNLVKTRQHCELSLAKLEGSWASDDDPSNPRGGIPQPWQRPVPLPADATIELKKAAAQIRGGAALPGLWLKELTAELGMAHDEMRNLETRLCCVHGMIQELSARQALHYNILDLDRRLRELYEESSGFESNVSRDPARLQDRTGKGRKELASEEAQRKQFQKNIRKCLLDLQKSLQQWELDAGSKFDAALLSDHAKEVRNAKTEATINGKTQLMHLESGMQVPGRRASGDSSEKSRSISEDAPAVDSPATMEVPFTPSLSPQDLKEELAAELNEHPSDSQKCPRSDVVCVETPMRPNSKSGQKNPFSKMVTSRKSMTPFNTSNSFVAEAPVNAVDGGSASSKPSAHNQENMSPLV